MSKIRINTEGKIKLFFTISLFIYSVIVTVIKENAYLICLPMFVSSFGDIMIMASRGCCTGKKEDTFLPGVLAFAGAHFVYVGEMETSISTTTSLICFVLFLFVLHFALERKRVRACEVYGVIILLNFINSTLFHPLAMVGMIFFMISDIILAIFEDKRPWWQIPIWIFYVAGQICIITSCLLV